MNMCCKAYLRYNLYPSAVYLPLPCCLRLQDNWEAWRCAG